MPKVHDVFLALKRKGYDQGKATRVAAAKTPEALATGQRPKSQPHREGRQEADPRVAQAMEQTFGPPKQ